MSPLSMVRSRASLVPRTCSNWFALGCVGVLATETCSLRCLAWDDGAGMESSSSC